jgi:hypothetical protein
MKAVKVDGARRIRLTELNPGDYYEAEIKGDSAAEVTLRRMAPPKRKWTEAEVTEAIDRSPRPFKLSWDELKKETR